MAEPIDPFEAAMQELSGETKPTPAAPVDPFAAAQAAMASKKDAPVDPFAAAQAAMDDPFAAAQAAMDDPFAAAQAALSSAGAPPDDSSVAVGGGSAPPAIPGGGNLDFLMDIKLKVSFEVGRAKMYISDLLSLGQGSVIELHRLVGEELEIYVNGHLLATGEVVVINEKFGAKITGIVTPEERVIRLAAVQ